MASNQTVTRAMVPVLLCFDVRHDEDATDEQISARIRALVTHNLGDIGEEADKLLFEIADETGADLDGALYPSDYDWCDTMKHARPDFECSREAVALRAPDPPETDDGPKLCPDCGSPNQFGELCNSCRRDQEVTSA